MSFIVKLASYSVHKDSEFHCDPSKDYIVLTTNEKEAMEFDEEGADSMVELLKHTSKHVLHR